jgi:hypothetical protein
MTHEERRLSEELVHFTNKQLLSEIERRMRVMREFALGAELCDGCTHQRFWRGRGRGEPPHDFNTCSLGHVLEFQMPEDPNGTDAGFYRPGGCADRKDPPPPAPPPPPPRGSRPAPVK